MHFRKGSVAMPRNPSSFQRTAPQFSTAAALSVAACLALLSQLPLVAQSAPAAQPAAKAAPAWPPSGPAPKNAEGKPDISGAWAPNAIRQNVDMVGAGTKVPFQPWAEKIYTERKTNLSKDDPEGYCLPPGVPRMSTTPYPFRISQTPGLTLIVYEGGAHVWRQIFTDGRKHDPDPNPSWLGDSIGSGGWYTFCVGTVCRN